MIRWRGLISGFVRCQMVLLLGLVVWEMGVENALGLLERELGEY